MTKSKMVETYENDLKPKNVGPLGQVELLVSLIFARYKDDGPLGVCGQSCSITNPWDKLYVFSSHEKFVEWARTVEAIKFRKNPRVNGYWGESGGEVKFYG